MLQSIRRLHPREAAMRRGAQLRGGALYREGPCQLRGARRQRLPVLDALARKAVAVDM